MTHPASVRAETLLSRVIDRLNVWSRGRAVHLRSVEVAEVARWAVEARQELLASRGDPVRGSIPEAVRLRVIARAAGFCEACHGPLVGQIHVDHIIPVARFGSNAEDNLRATCATCNLTKGAREAS